MQSKLSNFKLKKTFNVEVDKDDLSAYLDRISQSFEEHKVTLNYEFARGVVGTGGYASGFIAPLMSKKWNLYLLTTGADTGYWLYSSEKGLTSIEVLYTGKDIHEKWAGGMGFSDSWKGIWWEFATRDTRGLPPESRELERDYSYFQETGKDKLAKKSQAKHKGAIRRGLHNVDDTALKEVMVDINRILNEYWVAIMTPDTFGKPWGSDR